MTGGAVIVLGSTGATLLLVCRHFAYVFDEDQHFARRCNPWVWLIWKLLKTKTTSPS